MRIYLFLKTNILTFYLPKKISGSFNFAENPEEESKLINVEARDNNWYLYSTADTSVLKGDAPISEILVEKDNYYFLKRGDSKYLIYITDAFDDTFLPFNFNSTLNLSIGNDEKCNINFLCPFFTGKIAEIKMKDSDIILSTTNRNIYINNIAINSIEDVINIKINCGDVINIYGLKLFFLNGILLINNPKQNVKFTVGVAGLSTCILKYGSTPIDIPIKDVDLYNKDDYFSKSPRLRRQIIEKEINLSQPPRQNTEEKMPIILTVGPMLTMGVISSVMMVNTITKIMAGEAKMSDSWPSLVTAGAMLTSIIIWPTLTRLFNKKLKKEKEKELKEKYGKYLAEKREELKNAELLQRNILIENLIPITECLNIIKNGNVNFWDKRIEQNDFLEVRVGKGNELLKVRINYPEEGFTIDENELKKETDKMVEEFKYISDVPIGYSLYKSKITAIMGDIRKSYGMANNIILQLITFYSYEDIKIVLLTNNFNKDNWDYIKYLNHNFSNNKNIRFFSANYEKAKIIMDYLNFELQNRIQLMSENTQFFKPYYIIITDDYSQIKRHNFIKTITESDNNLGYSLVILEQRMSKLPSKCSNFINLGTSTSGILRNSFENQEQITFVDEIDDSINMMNIARRLSNIPIEFDDNSRELPDSITFLEMEKVGKVEQLNILNRWDTNDSTTSLRAEVGVDSDGNLMYLDLHEKYHGPHGLIAGMTGSGKSEFIITYILSMAINYSPEDVTFILIDYKGGGLAFAFENKTTGISLPHLAGTITNLDKAEMDRTLVSIDSEIKRRQKIFNDARDNLNESTMDIYKYQRYYKDGRLSEPVSHLFIICDEFAELKTQQPDFMDNLISVARIGRSLGIHLILATQKPSGVVNDQIWSNTKFRVCLKVQDAQDSREMLKRPEAASIKQTGRFYLQVGYDEYFALGQSAWCGARYYPSEKILKNPDKSLNFIDDVGNVIKSIQAGKKINIEPQGEQLGAILNNIIEVSKICNKTAKKLWLNNIEAVVLMKYLENKYNYKSQDYIIEAIIGEYDAPEKQEQGLLKYSVEDGNTIIYGNDEIEKEKFLTSLIFSICKYHTSKELNIYIIDYGSEQLKIFNNYPQIGGIVSISDDESLKNLFKLINDEIAIRKKKLLPYGSSLKNYNLKSNEKMPYILFIINNYDGLLENYSSIYEELIPIARDCDRYGIEIILSCNTPSSVLRKLNQNFNNKYAFHLTDTSEYYNIFNTREKIKIRDIVGRGLANINGVHEFQTVTIIENDADLINYLKDYEVEIKKVDTGKAKPIPTLPKMVTLNYVANEIRNLKSIPIGISKDKLSIVKYDFLSLKINYLVSNKLININSFIDSLITVFLKIKNTIVFFIDTKKILSSLKTKYTEKNKFYYFDNNLDILFNKLCDIDSNPNNKNISFVYIIYGIEKLKDLKDIKSLVKFFDEIKNRDNSTLLICESSRILKTFDYEQWYINIKNNSDGIWIGKGFDEQQNFRISKISKEMQGNYTNDFGFYVNENNAYLIKLIQFESVETLED